MRAREKLEAIYCKSPKPLTVINQTVVLTSFLRLQSINHIWWILLHISHKLQYLQNILFSKKSLQNVTQFSPLFPPSSLHSLCFLYSTFEVDFSIINRPNKRTTQKKEAKKAPANLLKWLRSVRLEWGAEVALGGIPHYVGYVSS